MSPEFGLLPQALPEASSLISNRANKGGLSGNATSAQDSDSESSVSQPAPELKRAQAQPLSLIFEHDQYNLFNVIPSRRHSCTDSDCDQPPQFIPTAPLTLEPPTPNAEESPLKARQRFHKAFTLVTKELKQRVKHLREPETPSLGVSLQPAAESGGRGRLEVMNTWGASEPALLRGGAAGNNAREAGELGYLMSTVPKSVSPLVYETVEEPTMGRDVEPEEPEIVVPSPVDDDMKSPPWLRPLRLVCQVHSIFGRELTNSIDSLPSFPARVVRSFSNHRKFHRKHLRPTLTYGHSHNVRYGPRPSPSPSPSRSPERSLPFCNPMSNLDGSPSRPVEIGLGHQEDRPALSQRR